MKALITKASDCDYEEIREFDSLEQLLQFSKDNGRDLIISTRDPNFALYNDQKKYADIDMEVKIYDFWIE